MNWSRVTATVGDWTMCTLMDIIQRRHAVTHQTPRDWRFYLEKHAGMTRDEYFAAPKPQLGDYELLVRQRTRLRWTSPIRTAWPDNDTAHVDYYLGPGGTAAPTVLMLHALMSASDVGYRRWAARFNERGWNACFLHLPYHYSRKPAWRMNGELAITADVIRTAEGLRQGVSEARQLMQILRAHGCERFALWATSYGGWIGSLLLSTELGFQWATLMAPIVDVGHAIWHSPAGSATRRELRRVGVDEAMIEEHFPLVSPLHAAPKDPNVRVMLYAGEYDRVVRSEDVRKLHQAWPGASFTRVPQGHFGYRLMRTAWNDITVRALV
jgi:pimeloyl-ACP methyl ester carboxylesterase